ncbi:MAG: hypothetical protein CR982_10750 [Candidatus Cloacimonadota bacterium]|nr:MAG: hypothetical protein CR982_10750 [Candidatus Cloacimonadota bacterium]PIE78583.1 MAG: hypothetical protein CSA15_06790 [Candidatus Delongbacteria bacterium]
MKKFLIKLIIFMLPLLIVAYPLDCMISYYLGETNAYLGEFEVWSDIYNSNANCDIAVYGSSRCWVHINPTILSDSLKSKVYNFGIDGHNFWLQYLRHLEFIKHNNKPKTIILSLDIFTLQKIDYLYQLNQFIPYMLWNSNIKKYTSSYVGYNYFDYYIPIVRYSGKINLLKIIIKSIFTNQYSDPLRNNGFAGMEKKWNNDLETAMLNKDSYYVKLDSSSILLFDRFIKECKKNNIELIFVYTPEFIEGQKFVSNRDEVIKIFEKVSSEYSIDFYNYSNDTICFNKKYFYNANHLNKTGAEIFSKDFANKIKSRRHKNYK